MKTIFKINNNLRKGYLMVEFALAAAVLSIAYFGDIIPNAYNRNQNELTDHTITGVISVYNESNDLLPSNALLHDPMSITTEEDYAYIKNQAPSGYDAIPDALFKKIIDQYFPHETNQFHGKVTVTSSRKCLSIETRVPSDQCVRYSMSILNKPETFGVKIGNGSPSILRKDGNVVVRSNKACKSNGSSPVNISALFCNTI
ncbi:hypothetical protein [Photobacterium damselae]|uniref:hypothetical protein n=1 Tax=Photobacterium damselae TaxID=38293 RepID=UPI0040688CDD